MKEELQFYVKQIEINSKFPKEEKTLKEQLKDFQLSQRELEVLKFLLKGNTNKQISEELYISINTVKSHIKNIYGKMDVRNRIQVIQKIKENTNLIE
ncbi:MAG: hypothetical protein CR986_05505 [Ignavibacteriae bacterium]|nr:MAG: hypothetical protein CR986_05505 [Ignavibacteriota bacterium]